MWIWWIRIRIRIRNTARWLTLFLTLLFFLCAAGHEHERRSGRRGELHLCPAGQGGSEQVLEAFPPAGRRRATRRQAHLFRDGERPEFPIRNSVAEPKIFLSAPTPALNKSYKIP
jgi:hypothetical protein